MASALVVLPQAPEPSSPPEIQDVAHIYAREDVPMTETIVATVAENNTCGSYYPNTRGAMVCDEGKSCMYEADKYNVIYCEGYAFVTGCIGRLEALNTRSCDEACRRNTNIWKCTESSQTHCNTIYYPNDISGFYCGTTSGFTSGLLPSRLDDSTLTTSLEVVVYPAEATAKSNTGTSGSETSNEATSTEATSTEPTSAEPTSTSTYESQNEGGGESKTNVGAIAGGVVGGVVGLASLGLLAFFLRRRSKNKKEQTVPEMSAQNSPQPYGVDAGQAWKQSPSPLQHSSPQVPVVEAPNSSAAQVHEMDGNGNRQ
ncbi:hypothetical protein NW766_010375 [Fusarium irregulare]|uniref:WSC domain-containing protein n=1 Tax=Fusarium irregulare TaxID=2494466 RepID=A0A9W8U5D4_9HYPO|nr:hypothetical protein NW766_010375 [Fusarium irregulare]